MILAIDPGNIESAYVVLNDDLSVYDKDKLNNMYFDGIFKHFLNGKHDPNMNVVIEMVACYGMPVGKSVFDTCVWIGRFKEKAFNYGYEPKLIYREDEKLNLCGTKRAKDSNIIQALVDRFAPNTSNKGKGTKKNPGWFYGFSKDIWQAYAVGVTYNDMYLK